MRDKKELSVLRIEKHMTQRQLAEKLNVSSGTIGMYETGKRMPTLNRAIQIAKIFDISVEMISFANYDSSKKERNSNYE